MIANVRSRPIAIVLCASFAGLLAAWIGEAAELLAPLSALLLATLCIGSIIGCATAVIADRGLLARAAERESAPPPDDIQPGDAAALTQPNARDRQRQQLHSQ